MSMTKYIVNYAMAKAISGKYKPNLKDKRKAYISLAIMLLLAVILFAMAIKALSGGTIVNALLLFFGAFACLYLIGISPWAQNPNNYRFEIEEGEPIQNLRIYYKGKPVEIDFVVGEDGKIRFADEKNKHSCVRWADGSKMSQFAAYRLANVFAKHMADIDLLSEGTKATFE